MSPSPKNEPDIIEENLKRKLIDEKEKDEALDDFIASENERQKR